MSLLNDALKAAEQRQGRPAPSAYVGGGTTVRSGKRGGRWLLVILTVLLVIGVAAWFYLRPVPGSNDEPGVVDKTPPQPLETPDAVPVEAGGEPGPVIDQIPVSPDTDHVESDLLVQVDSGMSPETVSVEDGPAHAGSSTVPEPATDREAASDADRQTRKVATSEDGDDAGPSDQSRPGASGEPSAAASEPAQVAAGSEAQSAPAATTTVADNRQPDSREPGAEAVPAEPVASSDIKQARKSPEQQDREMAKRIKSQLARDDLSAAEQGLREVTASQSAPASRYTFARGVLARGDVERALSWAPADLAVRDPDLRLIRARAQLAGGDLDLAVATLQQQVPPVADQVEYRVTLATLLQQQGRSDQAANHWAELIAWDSSRAPWWVGLAIALEGRGDGAGATRAYEQAATLPGLAPSLADYVRQRLQSLGAG